MASAPLRRPCFRSVHGLTAVRRRKHTLSSIKRLEKGPRVFSCAGPLTRLKARLMLSELFDLLLIPFTWFLQRQMTESEIRAFYRSKEWKRLRYAAIGRYGRQCLCCGARARIVVDHIKPVRTHPHLRLKLSNLQTLCDACNVGKGSRDRTDWRTRQ